MVETRIHIGHVDNLPPPWQPDGKTLTLVCGHLQGDLNATQQLQSQGYSISQIQRMADEPVAYERTRTDAGTKPTQPE